jgi:hypothetical protein
MRWLINYNFSEVYAMRNPRYLRSWIKQNLAAFSFISFILGTLAGVFLVRQGVIPV